MNSTNELRRDEAGGRWRTYAATGAAVATAAAVGSRAVAPGSGWYESLAKPPWQPPPWTFGVVWPLLYVSIAWASGRALLRSRDRDRRALAASLGINLALNAAWNHLFFGRRSTNAGVVGTVLLDVSNAELIRRTARADSVAAGALLPYAGWCAFATALNTDIAYRNRPAGQASRSAVTRWPRRVLAGA